MDRESIFRSGAAERSSRSGAYGIIFRRSMVGKEAVAAFEEIINRLLDRHCGKLMLARFGDAHLGKITHPHMSCGSGDQHIVVHFR